jgi:ketosteroid isomerase-like protein
LLTILPVLIAASCAPASREDVAATVIAVERGALERWGKGDPAGYLEIYAPEVTYFDPLQVKRIDGLEALRAMIAPLTGKIRVDRFDMIDPRVQHHGDVAVLTFNLLSYRMRPDGTEAVVARWNATAVYRATNGTWHSIHVHWSFIQPELKAPVSEEAS